LTRTSGRRVAAPSRDRRGTAPSAPCCLNLRCAATLRAGNTASVAARYESGQAPQRRRRCGSSVTRRSSDTAIQSSRQTRRPARAMAAGLVAASMGRRGQSPFLKLTRFSPANVERVPVQAGRGESGGSSQRGQGGGAPQAAGGHERRRARRVTAPRPARLAHLAHLARLAKEIMAAGTVSRKSLLTFHNWGLFTLDARPLDLA
jgi:hypothetical protein